MTHSNGERWRSWTAWLPWTAGLIGVLFSALVFISLHRTAIQKSKSEFESEAFVRAELIRQRIQTSIKLVNILSVFYDNSRYVDLGEFTRFADSLMEKQRFIEACCWAPAVRRDRIDQHLEQSLREVPNYDLDAAARNGTKPLLFPIVYVTGENQKHLVAGHDLASDPDFEAAVINATMGRSSLAEPRLNTEDNSFRLFTVVPHDGLNPANRVTEPNGDDREEPPVRGVIVGVVDVSMIVRETMPDWERAGFRLAFGESETEIAVDSLPTSLGDELSDVFFTHDLGMPGLPAKMLIQPTKDYLGKRLNRVPFLSLLLGLLLSALTTSMLRRVVGRTTHVEQLVDQRTTELQETNRRLEQQVVEREQVEEALNESLAAYQSLLESLPLNVFRKDMDGVIVDANQRFCDTIGHSVEETIGKTDAELFPLAQAQKYREDDDRVLQSGEVLEDVEEHVTSEGERLYVHVLKAPARDARGEIVGVQGMFWEVTSRVVAEEAQRLGDAKFRRLVESDIIGVMVASLDGRILQANDELLRIIASAPTELEAETLRWDTLTPEEYRPLDDFAIQQLEETGACRPWEKEYLRKDGTRVPILIGVAMVDDSSDECICWVLDITDRKRMEDELKNAKETADSASRAKSHFLANMSHEIRTPMNAIIGMTDLVLHSPLTTEQRDYLNMVQHSGEALLGVINDILDFSKVEAGKLEIDAKPFHLVDTIGDTMKSLALRAHAKHIELACDISSQVPSVLIGDSGRIRQVILNLVGNAIKFTDTGEVVLKVDVEREDDKEVEVHLQVRDTGIGIAGEKQQQIFTAFEQADSTTTRRFGGTGLGLAIARSLVELMGGKLWVESELGEGTTFHFTIAMDRCADVPELAEPIIGFDASQIRTLIVDDSSTNRQILSRIFDSWDMPHVVAEDTVSALEQLRAGEFDIVVADATMPMEDGFVLVERMRRIPACLRTPVIMLTSGDMPFDRQQCERLGVSAHLLKPVKKSELYDSLLTALASRDSAVLAPLEHTETEPSRALNILLAEDSAVNQTLAKALLERVGHQVTIAHNGEEAVQLTAAGQFDLVLMDVQMPVRDGLDASVDIRRRERLQGMPRLPIIALTAHAMKGDREKCIAVGMDDYLSKPIRAEELYATISRVAQRRDEDIPSPGDMIGSAGESSDMSKNSGSSENTISRENGAMEQASDNVDAEFTVDWDTALAAVNGSESLLTELSAIFSREGPRLLGQMETAIQDGDAAGLRIAAHTLKGSSRYFGDNPVSEQAIHIEKFAADGQLEKAEEPLDLLRSALPRLLTALKNRTAP